MRVQVVKELAKEEVRFRVLALSATPGSDLKVCLASQLSLSRPIYLIPPLLPTLPSSHSPQSPPPPQAVQQVVTNLQIGHIELRTEESFDIQRYVHERTVEKIVVPLEGEIAEVKNTFLKVHVHVRT